MPGDQRRPAPRPRAYPVLDGLRGVAAFLTVAHHTVQAVFGQDPTQNHVAVDFFFLLSGFILSYVYDPRLAAGLTVRAFFRHRLARLYPVYVTGTLIGLAAFTLPHLLGDNGAYAAHCFRAIVPVVILLNLAFIPAPLNPVVNDELNAFPFDIPAWSLFFELIVNLLYVGAYRFLQRGVLLAAAGAAWLLLATLTLRHGTIETGWATHQLLLTIPRVAFPFLLGIVLQRLVRERPFPATAPAWAVYAAFTALLLVVIPQGLHSRYDLGVVTVVFPLLLLAGSNARAGTSPLQRCCARLGAISYPAFAFHLGLITLFVDLRRYALHGADAPLWGDIAATAGLIALVIVLAGFWIDRVDAPLRRILWGHGSRPEQAGPGGYLPGR